MLYSVLFSSILYQRKCLDFRKKSWHAGVVTEVVYIGGDWLISLEQSSHFINSLTRLTLLKIAPIIYNPPPPTR